MSFFMSPFAAPALLVLGALVSTLAGRRSGASGYVAVISSALAATVGIPSALSIIASGKEWAFRADWSLPWSSFSLGMDGLSAFFFAFVLFLALPAAIYGKGYLAGHENSGWTGASWSFFQLLVASMLVVVTARDGLLFLLAWEVMSVSSFFLVIFDHEKAEVRSDALVYLVATHLGGAALFAMFGLWGGPAGSLDFETLQATHPGSKTLIAIFILAVAGFGSKAGFAPFHIWLPKAHPAAPSHVSALMSGMMIKMGIYGLMRVILLSAPVPKYWGYALLAIGAVSALGGVIYALAQHDIKRLLAYHSVENVGIITMGLGAGLVALGAGLNTIASVAFCGSILHVLNHGLFKSLLFFSGGAAAKFAGTRDMEHMGGLMKRMPVTGATFLIGSAAICALPPFNGFVSEWLIYTGLFGGAIHGSGTASVTLLSSVPVLALVGGLALACFAKAFGVVFLGEPRSEAASKCSEPSLWMTVPMVFTAFCCAAVGLAAPFVAAITSPASEALAGISGNAEEAVAVPSLLVSVVVASWMLVLVAVVLLLLRGFLLKGRAVTEQPTWGCGYTAPTARMQYTASSFAGPILEPLRSLMRPSLRKQRPKGVFPKRASFSSSFSDPADRGIFDPAVSLIERFASFLRPLQQGRLQIYLLYLLVTLVILLAWRVFT